MGIRYSPGSFPYQTSDRKTFKSALCHLLRRISRNLRSHDQ